MYLWGILILFCFGASGFNIKELTGFRSELLNNLPEVHVCWGLNQGNYANEPRQLGYFLKAKEAIRELI